MLTIPPFATRLPENFWTDPGMSNKINGMELHRSVDGYFHEMVSAALTESDLEAGQPTEFYLVNLLVDFTKNVRVGDEPLTLMLAQTREGSARDRARALKDVGDTSLYLAGFFSDYLANRMVDISYYVAVGGSAYGELANMPPAATATEGARKFYRAAYDELSVKFEQYVELLRDVRSKANFVSNTNILRLCEEWAKSGNDWIEERLRDTGMLAIESFRKDKLVH